MTVKANIIQIGNSRGIRLSKAVLEQSGLRDAVEIEVRDHSLVIRSADAPRTGWEEAFAEMARQGDDRPIPELDLPPSDWDAGEWQW